jgi:hypothetical protein
VTRWRVVLDTSGPDGSSKGKPIWDAADSYPMLDHSLALLVESRGRETNSHED